LLILRRINGLVEPNRLSASGFSSTKMIARKAIASVAAMAQKTVADVAADVAPASKFCTRDTDFHRFPFLEMIDLSRL